VQLSSRCTHSVVIVFKDIKNSVSDVLLRFFSNVLCISLCREYEEWSLLLLTIFLLTEKVVLNWFAGLMWCIVTSLTYVPHFGENFFCLLLFDVFQELDIRSTLGQWPAMGLEARHHMRIIGVELDTIGDWIHFQVILSEGNSASSLSS